MFCDPAGSPEQSGKRETIAPPSPLRGELIILSLDPVAAGFAFATG